MSRYALNIELGLGVRTSQAQPAPSVLRARLAMDHVVGPVGSAPKRVNLGGPWPLAAIASMSGG